MTVPVEPHGQPNHDPGWLDLLGATIAGTLSVGVNLAGPPWVAAVLGIAAPLAVGFIFPTAGTWPLVAGLLLAPLLAAMARGQLFWLVLLTLPVAAGLTFILVRIGQRLRAPGAAVDPEVRGKQVRLAIIVAIAAAVIVPGAIANARMSRDADARAQATGEKLHQVLQRRGAGRFALSVPPAPGRPSWPIARRHTDRPERAPSHGGGDRRLAASMRARRAGAG